jgi:dihydrodipicolinate synthase/N-acetylneuraminate lyase
MSASNAEETRRVVERRSFLQYAVGAVVAGGAVFGSAGGANAAPAGQSGAPAYVPGGDTRRYDRMYAAIVTPYRPGTEDIDETAFRAYMRYWAQPKFINAGGAAVVSPEAGEAFYLTQREKIRLAEIALEELGDKTMVFSGVMQTTTKACVEEAKALKKTGVHGLFLMPPIGTIDIVAAWDPERHPEVWIDQIRTIADATELPVIIHPTGGKHFGMPVKPALRIVDAVPQIVGYKMITNNEQEMVQALRGYTKRHVGILMAGAGSFHNAIVGGYFDGTVSGFWNYSMEPMVEAIVAARDKKDVAAAEAIWSNGLLALHRSVSGQKYGYRLHSAYKVCTWLRGHIADPFMRAPQRRLPLEEVAELRDLMKAARLEVISDRNIRKAYPQLT